jgi:hypothetical protein
MNRPRIWHPALVALYPILSTFDANFADVNEWDLVLPMLLTLSGTLVLWWLLARAMRDVARAGLVVSLLLLPFFSAGHALRAAERGASEGAFLVIVGTILLGAALCVLLRKAGPPAGVTVFFNWFSLIAVAIPASTIACKEAAWWWDRVSASGVDERALVQGKAASPGVAPAQGLPDIYYIILDGYGRSDVLKEIYSVNNDDFLQGLKRKGFFVASRSTSNYPQTLASLSSSLNCAYHDPSGKGYGSYTRMIRDSLVRRTLKAHGYRFVSYATGYGHTEVRDADLYLSPAPDRSAFHSLLLSNSLLILVDRESDRNLYKLHRQRISFVFESLGRVAQLEGPKFVFAHVVCPHPPFVFAEDGADVSTYDELYTHSDGDNYMHGAGNRRTATDYVQGYRRQVHYLNQIVAGAIDEILANSQHPPLVILQSDHGPDSGGIFATADPSDAQLHERFGNLNAYCFPERTPAELYDDITPVNTFRIVLNRYCGTNYDLLKDECWIPGGPYWRNVTSRARPDRDAVPNAE